MGCASGVSTDEEHFLFMLHSFISILDFTISNTIQPLISEREEIDAQHKVFPSKSQFLFMHREPTGHSVAQRQTSYSRSPQIGKKRSSGAFKHSLQSPHPQDLLVTTGLTLRQWDAAAGSFEAVCGGPQAALTASPHTQGCSARSFQRSLPTGQTPDKPLPTLLFPLKCSCWQL